MYDFSIPAEDIIKKIKKQKEQECRSDELSYPGFWMNFGPGVLAAMVGGTGHCGEDTIWFEPGKFEGCDIKDISIKLDRKSEWFLRHEEFFVAAAEHLDGEVHVGQTDIGGTLDILSGLRPGEMLMFDMYDNPDEVKRLTWEIHETWFEAFNYFNSLLPKFNHGYSAWAGLLSQKTHYMLQCDFAYMISPDQFEEFVLPELKASCKRIERPFYHLDGTGQLGHLDHLLSIPELTGIQWVPGDGTPNCSNWPELYQQIVAADRLVQVLVDEVDVIEKVLTQTDKPELMQFWGCIKEGEEERLNKIYRQYGIEPVSV
jgi:5-methyltetrahydrofolate--homocysteine methyltransferase